MKNILIILFVFMALFSQAQLTNVNDFKVANATTAFGRNIPIGTKVYNVATGDYWVATAGVVSTATLTSASASFTKLNSNATGTVTNVATGLGLTGGPITTTGTLLVDTASVSILSRQRAVNTYQPKGTYSTDIHSNITALNAVSGVNTGDQDLSGSGATLSGYILSLSGDGSTVTLPNEADGSTTNEIQTITNSSDATSHTVTLSNTGGSVQLVEGSNITLTTSGTGSAGVVTIASTGGGVTDHGALTGLSDDDHTQYSLASGTRAFTGIVSYNAHPTFTTDAQIVDKKYVDDAITAGGGYTDEQAQDATGVMVTGNTETGIDVTYDDANAKLNFVATDASISNEGSLSVTAGGASSSVLHSNTSGSTDVTINVAGINTISETASSITITGTEVDGSTTNEIEVVDEAYSSVNFNGGTTSATSQDDFYDFNHIGDTDDDGLANKVDLASAGFVKTDASGVLSVDGNTYLTTEVDGSITNEGSLTVAAGTATTSIINSNTSGQTGVTLEAGTNISISETGNTITITASGGSGDVTKVGTPVDNQVGVWTGNGTIEGDADLTFDGNILTTKVQKLIVQNGSKTSNWTHDAALGDIGAYQVNLAASTISIHNLVSGMQGTIFLNFVTTTPTTLTVNTFSDAGTTGLTEVVIGSTPTLAINKSTAVNYTCASDGTNTYVYLVYGKQN